MHISTDLYYDKQDIIDMIDRIVELKENLDATYDYYVLDDAIAILYELVEEGN